MGRRKIQISPLKDERNRTVTFVKRKAGLFKKAHELAVLCQVDLAVIIVGSNNKVYEFSTVETEEVLNAYNSTMRTRKQVHESKSPENYSDYKKKKHLHEPLTNKSGAIIGTKTHMNDDDDIAEEESEEYDSDDSRPQQQQPTKKHKRSDSKDQNPKVFNSTQPPPPPPPPHISLNNVPTFNNPKKFRKSKDEENVPSSIAKNDDTPSSSSTQRPVLRVQIPTDAKGNQNNNNGNGDNSTNESKDTARTITAVDTSANNQSNQSGNASGSSHIHTNGSNSNLAPGGTLPNTKFTGYSSFRSPDSRKPTLPLPVHTKSQTSSPATTNAPGLPVTGANNPYYSGVQQQQQSPQTNAYVNYPAQVYQQFQQFQQQLQQGQQSQQQQQQQQQQQLQQQMATQTSQPESAIRFRGGPFPTQFTNGEQTPISGLPSRYVNDMFPFPSPSNFLAPQDWPSGMTPTTHMPQYFMNLPLNSASQQGPPSLPNTTPSQQQGMMAPGYKSVNLAQGMFQIQPNSTTNVAEKISEVEEGTNPTTAGSTEDVNKQD
ncbi:SMP1 Transcription factor SMP1 [Candida maltosa Xu316]